MTFTDSQSAVFEAHRDLLQGIAYRMLGSVSDAEDMIQETWLRWQDAPPVGSPRSWLVTVLSRLCLDRLKSAQVQREHYFGTWLPEPLVTAPGTPAAEIDESVSLALLLVLEKLSPEERAGFLLHEVFGYTFEEIATILGKTPAACRKLVSRARTRVRADKPRFPATNEEHEQLLHRFLDACRDGEIEPLMALFADSTALYSDGGGKATAVPKVLTDRETIARFFLKIFQNFEKGPDRPEFRSANFNGTPGLLILVEGQIVSALSLEIQSGRIAAIFGHRNPDKLRKFLRQS